MNRILVIEDAPSLRKDIVEMLGFEGFDVVGAEDGIVGIERARDSQPDLILCDIMMPGINGFGVLETLRQDQATATIPFIFLTARTDRKDERAGMALGADDYLTKPFTAAELINSVNARLRKKQVQEEATKTQLNRLSGNIITALPHELRTPLNVILGFSDLMITDPEAFDAERTLSMAQHIHQAALRLYHLTENYITYAHTEIILADTHQRKTFQTGYILSPMNAIMTYANEGAAAYQRQQDVSFDLEDIQGIRISDEFLRKIIIEIVDNACKFSAKDSLIYITGIRDEGEYEICIADHGRGMTEQQIANIRAYNQFERHIYEDQGSGIGLILCKRLAELHEGNLIVRSELSVGTQVYIRLPIYTLANETSQIQS
jgi:CheY-like chemotaxis protein